MTEDDELPVIHRYTRAEAIDDGVLVDVSETAKEAGFRLPVAVTRRVWDEVVTPPPGSIEWGQSEAGRLWDVLWMARCAVSGCSSGAAQITYQLHVVDRRRRIALVTLKSVCGPGDDVAPVITIMMPDED